MENLIKIIIHGFLSVIFLIVLYNDINNTILTFIYGMIYTINFVLFCYHSNIGLKK